VHQHPGHAPEEAAKELGRPQSTVHAQAKRAEAKLKDLVLASDRAAERGERRPRSKPVYDELVHWCEQYQPTEPPSSLLAKAIQYLLNHHVALTRFLDDGRLPIDNGLIERIHRVPAVTRRNFLFAGSHAGAERAAIAYSIIATGDLLDVSPVHYLADVLPKLARGVFTNAELVGLTPAAWKRARVAANVATPTA